MAHKVVIGNAELWLGDCRDTLRTLPDCSIDSIVTDPPYGLSFMGKRWDYDVPSVEIWAECLRVLKPGGHLLAFAGTRTQHRMAVRIEDAGFEIRDMIAWLYGSGFPKSLDVSKAIDARGGASVAWFGPWFRNWREENGITQKQVAALFPSKSGGLTGCVANWELGFNMPTPEQFNLIRDTFALPFCSVEEAKREVLRQQRGTMLAVAPGQSNDRSATTLEITAPATDAARQWQGWGTALKPALEPITVARKPLTGTVAANVLAHGTGALNIDGCRIETTENLNGGAYANEGGRAESQSLRAGSGMNQPGKTTGRDYVQPVGRWPANVIHDGSDEVLAAFPHASGQIAAVSGTETSAKTANAFGRFAGRAPSDRRDGGGNAARFFYCAKASRTDRGDGNAHPTVKPTDLMRYLCRLVTPPGGVVLDPFAGSGSTGKAAMLEGFGFAGIEREPQYFDIACRRIEDAQRQARMFE